VSKSISTDQIIDFMTVLLKEVKNFSSREGLNFDANLARLLKTLLDFEVSQNANKIIVGYKTLADLNNLTVRQTRCRLVLLARYGIIRVEAGWINSDKPIRQKSRVIINAAVKGIIRGEVKARMVREYVRHLAEQAARRSELEGEYQGFQNDCLYGEVEPEKGIRTPEDQIADVVSREDEKKAERLREAASWRNLKEQFVLGAGRLWQHALLKHGLGKHDAVWAKPAKQLSQTARAEYNNLGKTFETYGGRLTCLAWLIYCGVEVGLDLTGWKYDRLRPYLSTATIDKKPGHFVKNFNSILLDPVVREIAQTQWQEHYKALKVWFGEIVNTPPRYQKEHELIDFEFQAIEADQL
jgi:hypothetical protein